MYRCKFKKEGCILKMESSFLKKQRREEKKQSRVFKMYLSSFKKERREERMDYSFLKKWLSILKKERCFLREGPCILQGNLLSFPSVLQL